MNEFYSEGVMLIYQSDVVEIHRRDKIIHARFLRPHRVISTCPAAGGVRDDLEYVYNHQSCEPTKHDTAASRIMSLSPEQYREETADRFDLPAKKCATLGTAANMRCAAVAEQTFRDLTVVAVCTGGVETNGGRAGDPATIYETDGRYERIQGNLPGPGTINTMLFINRTLTQGALVRSVMMSTEAKTAALQELSVPSRYSIGLATGTGTDQIAVATLLGDAHPLRSAGKHSKLGELIGVTVHDAIKETLARQNGLTPESRCSMVAHLTRFGATQSTLIEGMTTHLSSDDAALLKNNFLCLNHDPLTVAATTSLVHNFDQLTRRVLPASCAPDILRLGAAQIAATVSGRFDAFDRYLSMLSPRKALDNETLVDSICRGAALGFADKWQPHTKEKEATCREKVS